MPDEPDLPTPAADGDPEPPADERPEPADDAHRDVEPARPVVDGPPPAARPPAPPDDHDPARRRFLDLADQLRRRPVGRLLDEYLQLRRQLRRR